MTVTISQNEVTITSGSETTTITLSKEAIADLGVKGTITATGDRFSEVAVELLGKLGKLPSESTLSEIKSKLPSNISSKPTHSELVCLGIVKTNKMLGNREAEAVFGEKYNEIEAVSRCFSEDGFLKLAMDFNCNKDEKETLDMLCVCVASLDCDKAYDAIGETAMEELVNRTEHIEGHKEVFSHIKNSLCLELPKSGTEKSHIVHELR